MSNTWQPGNETCIGTRRRCQCADTIIPIQLLSRCIPVPARLVFSTSSANQCNARTRRPAYTVRLLLPPVKPTCQTNIPPLFLLPSDARSWLPPSVLPTCRCSASSATLIAFPARRVVCQLPRAAVRREPGARESPSCAGVGCLPDSINTGLRQGRGDGSGPVCREAARQRGTATDFLAPFLRFAGLFLVHAAS